MFNLLKKKPIKSCGDCKWFKRWSDQPDFSGKGLCFNSCVSYETTDYARNNSHWFGGCGKGAKYFEARN